MAKIKQLFSVPFFYLFTIAAQVELLQLLSIEIPLFCPPDTGPLKIVPIFSNVEPVNMMCFELNFKQIVIRVFTEF